MNLKATKTKLQHVLLGGAVLASMLGGMAFTSSAFAEESALKSAKKCYYYTLANKTNRGVSFNIDRSKAYLPAHGKRSLRRCFKHKVRHPLVRYDSIIGDGYKLARVRLIPGYNGFDRQGKRLILKNGNNGPGPNSF